MNRLIEDNLHVTYETGVSALKALELDDRIVSRFSFIFKLQYKKCRIEALLAEWLKTFSSRTESPEVDPLFLLILGHPETQIQIQQKKNPDTLDGIPPFFHTELCID